MELSKKYIEIENKIKDNLTRSDGLSVINFLIGYFDVNIDEVDFNK